MAYFKYFLVVMVVLFTTPCFAQNTANTISLIGTWKGTSTCQVKPSACNDEIAVYHVTKEIKPGIFHVAGNKLVNGKEEEMGEFDFSFSAADSTLTYVDEKRKFTIKFTVKGSMMEGTLVSNSVVYRIIKLAKQQ
jgi:hypothetical protein